MDGAEYRSINGPEDGNSITTLQGDAPDSDNEDEPFIAMRPRMRKKVICVDDTSSPSQSSDALVIGGHPAEPLLASATTHPSTDVTQLAGRSDLQATTERPSPTSTTSSSDQPLVTSAHAEPTRPLSNKKCLPQKKTQQLPPGIGKGPSSRSGSSSSEASDYRLRRSKSLCGRKSNFTSDSSESRNKNSIDSASSSSASGSSSDSGTTTDSDSESSSGPLSSNGATDSSTSGETGESDSSQAIERGKKSPGSDRRTAASRAKGPKHRTQSRHSTAQRSGSSDAEQEARMKPVRASRSRRDKLIAAVLARWWYCMEEWPPADYDYEKALRELKLKEVSLDSWEDLDDVDSEGYTKVYQVSFYPGVFRDPSGRAIDLRPSENKPCYERLNEENDEKLLAMLIIALKNQLKQLAESPYWNTDNDRLLKLESTLQNTLARTERDYAKFVQHRNRGGPEKERK